MITLNLGHNFSWNVVPLPDYRSLQINDNIVLGIVSFLDEDMDKGNSKRQVDSLEPSQFGRVNITATAETSEPKKKPTEGEDGDTKGEGGATENSQSDDPDGEGKNKRRQRRQRTHFTSHQLQELETVFAHNR